MAMIAMESQTMKNEDREIIKKGDYVFVTLPHESKYLECKVDNIRRYDRQTMQVSRKVKLKNGARYYFELEGAVSDGYGIPFGFLQEWLTKI